MRSIRYSHLLLALMACQAGASAWAADAIAAAPAAPAFGAPISESALEGLRGGTDTTASDMQLSGTTASNTAYQLSTGNNAISSGSFSGLSGIPMVIQNTGANVLIQNAVILNLQVN